MKLLIIGPQAAGKGTQADLLAKKLGIPHISTGEILREEERKGTPFGVAIGRRINDGSLIPDNLIWQITQERLDQNPNGWILDGFPRNEEQAKTLDAHAPVDKVLIIDVPKEVTIERISGRRICSSCGKDYHVKYKPPQKENCCDDDRSALEQREDDTPKAIEKRLAIYHMSTEPLIQHYKERVIMINGNQGIQEVFAEIQQKLGL